MIKLLKYFVWLMTFVKIVTQMHLLGTPSKRPPIMSNGDIINFIITQANVDDRAPLKDKSFVEKVFWKLYKGHK